MNFSAVIKGIVYLVQYFFTPTPQQTALKNFAGEAWSFLAYCAAYPRAAQLETTAEAVILSLGATVVTDPTTGHITSVTPPADAGGSPNGTNRGGLMPPGT